LFAKSHENREQKDKDDHGDYLRNLSRASEKGCDASPKYSRTPAQDNYREALIEIAQCLALSYGVMHQPSLMESRMSIDPTSTLGILAAMSTPGKPISWQSPTISTPQPKASMIAALIKVELKMGRAG
jgi:hypothetical protein